MLFASEHVTRKERNLFMNELDAIKRIPRHPNVIAFIGTCGKKGYNIRYMYYHIVSHILLIYFVNV